MPEKIRKIIIWSTVAIITISTFFIVKGLNIESDTALFPILGRDIAGGNLFLGDWFGTEQPLNFLLLGVQSFWSFFIHNYFIANAISTVSILGLLAVTIFFSIKGLSAGKSPNIFSILILMIIIVTMQTDLLIQSIPHLTTALCATFFAYIYYIKRESNWAKWAIIAMIIFWTDDLLYLYLLFPLLAENIIYYFKNKKWDNTTDWLMYGMLGYMFRKLIIAGRGIEHITYDSGNIFINLSTIPDRLLFVLKRFLELFSFSWDKINPTNAVAFIFFGGMLLLAVYSKYKLSNKVIKETSYDNRLLTFMFLGLIVVFAFVLLQTSSKWQSIKYMPFIFLNIIIFLGYHLNEKFDDKKLGIILICTFIASSVIKPMFYNPWPSESIKERSEVANTIRVENLHNGFTTQTLYNTMKVAMNDSRFAPIFEDYGTKKMAPVEFEANKNDFYDKIFDFVLAVKDPQPDDSLTDENIRIHFGNPKRTIDVGKMRLYIYDNITDKIEKPVRY